MTPHDEQVAILHADRRRDKSLVGRLAEAEAELHTLAEEAKAAYAAYRTIDAQVTAKGHEVRNLKLQIREAADAAKTGDQA